MGGSRGLARPFAEAVVAEALIARVDELAAPQPLVLALEDIQWADAASVAGTTLKAGPQQNISFGQEVPCTYNEG